MEPESLMVFINLYILKSNFVNIYEPLGQTIHVTRLPLYEEMPCKLKVYILFIFLGKNRSLHFILSDTEYLQCHASHVWIYFNIMITSPTALLSKHLIAVAKVNANVVWIEATVQYISR